ncbi:hypothetical protein BCR34DRAFT_562483 [Clohesyomyces aquaticus]|uniref:Ubiquitin-like domain-containing protein n=1 Tax=Clohesyomyces aquaticus TaxID=1231657 RepID=A0A1Y1ZSG2_9PLEO|nr:hypothetical protein BCR34DRAFT_562483 [Clohesyomyces aquaticus]
MIAHKVRRPHEWSAIVLSFTGCNLDDGKTIKDYGIQDDDTIFQGGSFDLRSEKRKSTATRGSPNWTRPNVDCKQIKNLHFKHIDGQTFTLQDIPVMYTGKQLNAVLRYEKGIDEDGDGDGDGSEDWVDRGWMRMICSGKQLDNDKTLEDCDVQEDSTIFIVARLPGGHLADRQ